MYTDMENWAEIRRRVLADGLSGRAACREYKIHWKTLRKILEHTEPPGYRRTKPRRPSILDPLLPVVHQILEDDKKAPPKQRHTAKLIFHRLRAEHGYAGGLTTVKDAVHARRRSTRAAIGPQSAVPVMGSIGTRRRKRIFLPLAPAPPSATPLTRVSRSGG